MLTVSALHPGPSKFKLDLRASSVSVAGCTVVTSPGAMKKRKGGFCGLFTWTCNQFMALKQTKCPLWHRSGKFIPSFSHLLCDVLLARLFSSPLLCWCWCCRFASPCFCWLRWGDLSNCCLHPCIFGKSLLNISETSSYWAAQITGITTRPSNLPPGFGCLAARCLCLDSRYLCTPPADLLLCCCWIPQRFRRRCNPPRSAHIDGILHNSHKK